MIRCVSWACDSASRDATHVVIALKHSTSALLHVMCPATAHFDSRPRIKPKISIPKSSIKMAHCSINMMSPLCSLSRTLLHWIAERAASSNPT